MTSRPIAVLLLLLLSATTATAGPPATRPATFTNPLKADGADPWITFHDGFYYLTTTTSADIRMRRAPTLGGLKTAEDQVVWADQTPGRADQIWAAEFHLLDDGTGTKRWYGYYTAAHKNTDDHRMFVIEGTGPTPLGPYHFKAKLATDPADAHTAIDGTPVRNADGALYLIWSGAPSPQGLGLFAARMKNPWTIDGPRHALAADGFGCPYVREGPAAVRHGGKIYLLYSMCGATEPDYRLGLLVADEQADLADPAAWKQHPAVVFARNDPAGVYGPGHCFVFTSPDGKQFWIAYHAKTTPEITYADRTARAQPFTWNPDGTPALGVPLPTSQPIAEPSR